MKNNMLYHSFKLNEALASRKLRNPNYSLRSFARDLEIAAATLCKILKGERNVPKNKIQNIALKLELSPAEEKKFSQSNYHSKKILRPLVSSPEDTVTLDEEIHFRIIADWEYFAFISLMDTKSFQSDPQWIARRLSIGAERVRVVMAHLVAAKLIYQDENGQLIKKCGNLDTSQDIASNALKSSHFTSLKLAAAHLERTKIHMRDYTSNTLAIDPHQIPLAKKLIQNFYDQLEQILAVPESTEVYQCNIQLFPLTKTTQEN